MLPRRKDESGASFLCLSLGDQPFVHLGKCGSIFIGTRGSRIQCGDRFPAFQHSMSGPRFARALIRAADVAFSAASVAVLRAAAIQRDLGRNNHARTV